MEARRRFGVVAHGLTYEQASALLRELQRPAGQARRRTRAVETTPRNAKARRPEQSPGGGLVFGLLNHNRRLRHPALDVARANVQAAVVNLKGQHRRVL